MITSRKAFFNGKIYQSFSPRMESWGLLAVNGVIQDLYSHPVKLPSAAELVDLQGLVVLPGFTDSHLHLLMFAENFARADLTPAKSETEAVKILQDWALKHNIKPGDWVRGRGFSVNDWQPSQLPSVMSLDSAFPDNPVYATSKCGNLIWVNSRSLEMAGLKDATRQTLEQWGNRIGYFPDGKPSGVFKEEAEALIFKVLPPLSTEEQSILLQQAISCLNRYGVFAIHNMEGFDSLELLINLIKKSSFFPLRLSYYIDTNDINRVEKTAAEINNARDLSQLIQVEGIKIFVDGSLGGRTAWLSSPYEGEPENYGICTATAEELSHLVYEANKRQLVAAVHAIGDRAILQTLQVFQQVAERLRIEKLPPVQNRIEHYQLVSPEILELTTTLTPVISMQPLHLAGDWQSANKHWGARSRFAYAFKSALATQAPLIFGSDAPVESPDPWCGVCSAVTRQDLTGEPPEGWYSQEKISLDEALTCYTSTPCSVVRFKTGGKLIPAHPASFIILDKDPFTIPPSALKDIKVIASYFNGQRVFGEI
ncbi:MAG: amidohydrolase [Candidatus Sumerlaeia bacterium]|nr:amidohydrolase [Candidatus Sumerlaeia bacterium]